jgi:hypothetical protein
MKTTLLSFIAAISLVSGTCRAQFVPSGYGAARSINPPGSFATLGYSTIDVMAYRQQMALAEQEAIARAQAQQAEVANENAGVSTVQMAAIPQTTSSIDATIEPHGQVLIHWTGVPDVVKKITFSLLDNKKNMIKEKSITRLPAEARFTMTNKTAYYRTVVEYINGTKTTVTSLL